MKLFQMRITALATLALALASTARADDTSAEVGNVGLVKAFQSAWNSHDMEGAFRKLLTDDVDWVNVNAGRGKGIDAVVQGHVRVHAGKFKDSVMKVNDIEVEPLKPDVCLVYVSWGISGDRDDDGTAREPREGLLSWVTVKQGGVWKIRASHNTNKTPVH
ncbi:MAG TPA: SgcJ/EcaC family oxidoreductase [Steroidobacteraceae bacterium]|nr:SgcJ/EcaC family oxidoreductase [Steroidobacteraceae bacterium]